MRRMNETNGECGRLIQHFELRWEPKRTFRLEFMKSEETNNARALVLEDLIDKRNEKSLATRESVAKRRK